MKIKFLKIFLIFIIFVISILIFINQKKLNEYKILKVIKADTYYIDINKNNIADENELFNLAYIKAFEPYNTKEAIDFCKRNNIDIETYLKNGYVAVDLVKNKLEGKFAKIKFYKNSKIEIFHENINISEFLLENGLAYIENQKRGQKYFPYLNLKQTIKNSKELSTVDFIIINLKNGIFHNLNCEFINKIKNAKLELKSETNYLKPCKICYNSRKINNEISSEKIPKSKNIYKKSINKSFKNIDLYLINPLEYSKPNTNCTNNFCKRLINEINNSKTSIDIAIYGIGKQHEILEALKNAKEKGVKIRCVVDYTKNSKNKYENTDDFIKEFSCISDKTEKLMHNKFFIFDNKLVLTGSTNISSTGSGGYNSNLALFIKDLKIAQIYKNEFEQMYNHKFSNEKEKLKKEEIENIKIYFSPQDNALQNEIIPSIKNAKKSIYVSAFYLTEKNIINELINAKKRGIEVYIIVDALGAKNFSKLIIELRKNKIPTIVENWGGKNHEKTMMIDWEKLITGSSNFSKSGLFYNDENIISIKNPDIASFYADYFLYLFNSIDTKYLSAFPKAEGPDSKNSCFDGIDNDFDGKIDFEDEACNVKKNKK